MACIRSPSFVAGADPKHPRCFIIPQMMGFHVHQTIAASRQCTPAMTSGTDPNPSGIAFEISVSRRIFHFETPPIIGELRA